MSKTKFFRVAVEGATTDGRVIERAWIQDMGGNYNPATYGARINMEHIRGFSDQPPFCAYGDILATKAEEIDIEINGAPVKRLALFVSPEGQSRRPEGLHLDRGEPELRRHRQGLSHGPGPD